MGLEGTEGTAAGRPTGLDDDGPAPAVLVAAVAGLADFLVAAVSALAVGTAGFLDALVSFAPVSCAAEETFLAAGTACFAAGAFLTAGLVAGVAFAAGFFTVTGSFDELERAFTGCLLPWNLARRSDRPWSLVSGCPPVANPGVIPRKPATNVRRPVPEVTSCPCGSNVAAGTGARLYRELASAGDVSACGRSRWVTPSATPLASPGVVGGATRARRLACACPHGGGGLSDHST